MVRLWRIDTAAFCPQIDRDRPVVGVEIVVGGGEGRGGGMGKYISDLNTCMILT